MTISLTKTEISSVFTGTTASLDISIPPGFEKLLVVAIACDNATLGSVTSVKLGRHSLTKSSGVTTGAQIWYLKDPAYKPETQSIDVVMASSCNFAIAAYLLENVNQSTPIATYGLDAQVTGEPGTPGLLACPDNSIIIDAVRISENTISADSPQVEVLNDAIGSGATLRTFGSSYKEIATAGNYDIGWTRTGTPQNKTWGWCGVVVQSSTATSSKIICSGGSNQTIAFDSSEEISVETNLAVFSHTCTGTDLDGYLFVMVAGQSGLNFSNFNVGYAGKKMELLFEDNNSAAFVDLAIWGMKNPPAGTDFVGVGTGGLAEKMYIATASFTGVDEGLPIEASNSASGTSTSPSVSVTTETDNAVVVDFVAGQIQLSDPTQDGSQTLIEKGQSPSGFQCGAGMSYEAKATAGSVSMDWTLGTSADWYHFAVALRPAGGRPTITGISSITF